MPAAAEQGIATAGEASGNRGAYVIAGRNDCYGGIASGYLWRNRWIITLDRTRHDETSFFDIHWKRGEVRGQAIGPNQTPAATLNALIKPKTASAAANAAKTP